ncbi:O-antigen ligase family protein [Bradyrhizobium sp. 183]|uniref:O-antigen ligase family protein n=1 Tax=unclassified Bradyrhizobium TaxID=2631580 RepID=UPI001FFE8DDB|nr:MULTISPECIES: O-antigen ligase family protein [unclassified Bradyrhizobium]UPJ78944.1 O-antigen ligase family protein [Bradyrhizobium sp. 184]UPJ86737.1 O-antigen ligase family protein [Bradyrhizobium sp. 183]
MPVQDEVLGRRTISGSTAREAQGFRWVAPLLSSAFVLSWAIEPDLLGEASSIVPSARWAIVVFMCLLVPFVSGRGVARGWSIAFLLFALAFTMILSGALDVSFPIFARILGAGVLAMFAGTLPLSERLSIVRYILMASVAVVVGSLAMSLIAPERAFHLIGLQRERLYGLTSHPAIIGYFASLVATVFGSAALFTRRSKGLRLRDGFIAAISALVVYLADSRTGEIAFPLALCCEFVVMRLINSGLIRRSIMVPWLLFGGAVLMSTMVPIAVATDIIPVSVKDDQYAGSTAGRIALWKLGLSDFESNMVVGNGLGTTFATADLNADKNLLFYYHSVVINYLAKSGIVGTVAIIALLLSSPYACLAGARRVSQQRPPSPDELIIVRFVVAACTVTVAFATIEAALQNLYPSFLIFFLSITLLSRARA